MKKDDMDDDYELEGKLVPLFDIPYSVRVLRMTTITAQTSSVWQPFFKKRRSISPAWQMSVVTGLA